MFFANHGEEANRIATALGVIERVRANGKADRVVRFAYDGNKGLIDAFDPKDMRKVWDVVSRVNDRVHFRYDLTTRPEIMWSPVGQTIGQFKQFVVGSLELHKRYLDLLADGKTRENLSPYLLYLGGVAAMSGILGLPGWQAFDEVVRRSSGVSPTDEFTKRLPQFALRGAPALLGVDASRRIGQGDFFQLPDLGGPASSTAYDVFSRLLTDPVDAARSAGPTPRVLVDTVRRLQGEMTGTRDRLRYTPDTADVLVGMTGFRPLHETEIADQERIQKRANESLRDARATMIDRILTAREAGDFAGMREAQQEARDEGLRITADDLRRERRQKALSALERLQRQTPKARRREFAEQAGPELQRERARRVLGVQ
jgi:hypothetical protein